MEVEPEPTLEDLVASLEQAAVMAKQIGITSDLSRLFHIYAALNTAHHHLSRHLSQFHPSPPLLQHPQRLENSVSSAVVGGETPMVTGDEDDDEEQNSRTATMDRVEEKLRECFIQNKRPKRQLSPSAEQRRGYENETISATTAAEFDPLLTKLRSLDLIYQFHA